MSLLDGLKQIMKANGVNDSKADKVILEFAQKFGGERRYINKKGYCKKKPLKAA